MLNDSFTQNTFYSRFVRSEVHQKAKSKNYENSLFIFFGPTDINEKSKKQSALLSTSKEGSNVALKAVSDILTI